MSIDISWQRLVLIAILVAIFYAAKDSGNHVELTSSETLSLLGMFLALLALAVALASMWGLTQRQVPFLELIETFLYPIAVLFFCALLASIAFGLKAHDHPPKIEWLGFLEPTYLDNFLVWAPSIALLSLLLPIWTTARLAGLAHQNGRFAEWRNRVDPPTNPN